MSTEEAKVLLENESTGKSQWGKGMLFLRKEGRKLTVVPRNITILLGVIFSVLGIALILFSPADEARNSSRKGEIGIPMEIIGGAQVEVPQFQGNNGGVPQGAAPHLMRNGASKSRYSGPQVVARPRGVKIPPGSMVRAVLVSGASDGPVTAEVKEALTLQGETLIEPGTTLIGQGQSGDDRLTVRFSQMVYRDGAFEAVSAQACDADDRIAGIKGSKTSREAMKLAAGVGLNFVGGMAQGFQSADLQSGFSLRKPSVKNAMLNGASTAALEQAQGVLSDYRNKKQTIQVPAHTEIWILFEGGL